jgi:hypothetical protein
VKEDKFTLLENKVFRKCPLVYLKNNLYTGEFSGFFKQHL